MLSFGSTVHQTNRYDQSNDQQLHKIIGSWRRQEPPRTRTAKVPGWRSRQLRQFQFRRSWVDAYRTLVVGEMHGDFKGLPVAIVVTKLIQPVHLTALEGAAPIRPLDVGVLAHIGMRRSDDQR
jgi:hypothetical protein